ncbi:MAG: 50S ribosomal protein L11 methyltransferase [Oscillospiraceae bacterium]|nr:50S ribosomal protein L11 methyltransferase [Oscillospiraceae bacterium]
MDYLELIIATVSDGIDIVVSSLTAAGFEDLVIEDQAEFESFLEDNREYWDYIDESLQHKLQGLSQIKLYLEAGDEAGLTRLKQLLQELKDKNGDTLGSLELTVKPLASVNWEESWKDNYPPQPVGNHLMVLPCWLDVQQAEDRLPVILDPGLTFGTGAHPSTQMVMEFMEEENLAGKSCLDLGSGSGILSITALRLGAKTAVGVDIDPKAEDIARENAAYNGFASPEFTALTGNVTADQKLMQRLCREHYDLVLVNIVADVIISLAPVLPAFLQEDSVLLLSGILDTRLGDVICALEKENLTVAGQKAKEDWRSLKVRKKL